MLLHAGPPPVATRRWVHCGWDASFYENEAALAFPKGLIEAVVQNASGFVQGRELLEVLGAPSRLNLQDFQGEEECTFPVRFISCEDAGIADWAASALVAGRTERCLPKQSKSGQGAPGECGRA